VSFDAFLGRKLPLMIVSPSKKTGISPITETAVFPRHQNIPLRGQAFFFWGGGMAPWPPDSLSIRHCNCVTQAYVTVSLSYILVWYRNGSTHSRAVNANW